MFEALRVIPAVHRIFTTIHVHVDGIPPLLLVAHNLAAGLSFCLLLMGSDVFLFVHIVYSCSNDSVQFISSVFVIQG
jgi:hypothetical protein